MENNNFVCSIDWLAEKIAELSSGRYYVSAKSKDYTEIVENDDWKAICFHFEIRPIGYNHGDVLSSNIVNLVAHYHFDRTNPSHQKVIEHIKYMDKTKNTCTKAKAENVTINFSNESSAVNSVKRIIERFDSFMFQQSAKQANACIKILKDEGMI